MTIVDMWQGNLLWFSQVPEYRNRIPPMIHKSLATITTQRRLSHAAGETITLQWDDHQFRLSRAALSRFARVLEQGKSQLYAAKKGFSVVAVDDETREVWIGKSCIALNPREYRSLLNAALRTETRLHGLRGAIPPQRESRPEPSIRLHAPEPLRLCWN